MPTHRIWDSLPKPILPNSAKCPYLAHFANFFSAKWASEFGKVRKAVVYISKNRLFESENIMWGISDVCTLALTVAKTSSHYDRFAIFVPDRSLLLFDLAYQDGNISGPKGQLGTRGNGDISETRFIL